MRGFTLLELVIALAVISILLAISFPSLHKRELSSEELFKNRFSALVRDSFMEEVCLDFSRNSITIGGEKVNLPYPPEKIILPRKVISREGASSFCFRPTGFSYFSIVLVKDNRYLVTFSILPVGETEFFELSEAEEETFKDKLVKGRVLEWFSYYSS